MPHSLGILGATGKMGRRIIALSIEDPAFKLIGGVARETSAEVGLDLGVMAGLEKIGALLEKTADPIFIKADVVIDFSLPLALQKHIAHAIYYAKPLVIGSTGHTAEDKELIKRAAQHIPLLYAANFSMGMALCSKVAQQLNSFLGSRGQVSIVDHHHAHKKDAPSGTALALASALKLDASSIQSIREGETIGEHILSFNFENEIVELKHSVLSRDAFAKGALKAAQFLVHQPAGLYTIEDVLYH